MVNPMNISHRIGSACMIALVGVAVVSPLSGCREDRSSKPPRQFFPDMDDQPKWKNQSKSDFFADGRVLRPAVDHAVPFGRVAWVRDDAKATESWSSHWMQQRRDLLREDAAMYTGMNADGTYVERIPLAVDKAMLELGRKKYEINCAVCHGYSGDGKGTVGVQWSAPVPSYHDPKYTDPSLETARDGYMFFIIRNGVRTMPAYGHTLNERDAWAVVSYVRALQATRAGTIEDVPENRRGDVNKPQASATGGAQ